MASYRVGEVAVLLGVSPDTVRRWTDSGRLHSRRTGARGQRLIDGEELAHFAQGLSATSEISPRGLGSARNHFAGIVTKVVRDRIMAQVEIHAGGHRVVSLISREAADELALAPGVSVVAAVKATNVTVERPG